jgi:hypothetical protein
VNDLNDLCAAVRKKLENESRFLAVNTRLVLRTGVSLREIKPAQQKDPAVIAKVTAALTAMGIGL